LPLVVATTTGCSATPSSRHMMLPLRVRRYLREGENVSDAGSRKRTSENSVNAKFAEGG